MHAIPCCHSDRCFVIPGKFTHFHTNSKPAMFPKMHVISLYDAAIS